MLFTDSDIVTFADLEQVDSEFVRVSKAAKPPITIDGPRSVCELAWRHCANKMTAAQQLYSTFLAQPGTTSGHLSAVLNVGVPSRNQPRVRLNQIVADDSQYSHSSSGVQLWMTYEALALFYKDASERTDEDRYALKASRYASEAGKAWRLLRAEGLPFVYQPMEAPGGKHSFNAGDWSVANLAATAGGSSDDLAVRVAVTWYDASKYISPASNGNAESSPSTIIAFTIPAGNVLTVSIAGLNPPNGAMDPVGTSTGTWLPLNATHWNLYVGQGAAGGQPGGPLYLQEAIPIGTKSVTLAGVPTFSGPMLPRGQWPDLSICFQNIVQAG